MLLGQSAALTWTTTDATSCNASGGWSGAQAVTGSTTVTPDATGSVNYTLECAGSPSTANATQSATLTVTAATLSQLQASVFMPRCAVCHDGSQPAGGSFPGR